MMQLSLLFSSSAKFEVLGLLCQRSSPLPLRHISYLTGLPIRSVELAVAALSKQETVHRQRAGRQVLISFNEKHDSAPLLREIFALVSERTRASQPNMDRKAQQVLAFVDSATSLLGKAGR